MEKGQNYNRPRRGSKIKVEPIRKKKDINLIRKLLSDKPLDLALFTVGINTNLRASDLLRIERKQVIDKTPGDSIELKEQKTGKIRRVTLNRSSVEAINDLLASKDFKTGFVFEGQRGVLTVPSVHQKVKQWCKDINLEGNYGSHSLRKTWGYHQRVMFGTDLPRLMVCFNHSSQKQTLDYLCIQPEEIKNVYENEI